MSKIATEKYKYCNWCKHFKKANKITFVAYDIAGICSPADTYVCAWQDACRRNAFKYNIHGVFDFLSPDEINEYVEAYHLRFFTRSVERGKCKNGQRYR